MAQIIRGTTPTIKFTYNDIEVGNITSAILTLKQGGSTVIEKDLTSAQTQDNMLVWTLTQEETLSLSGKSVTIVCDWLLNTGVRGRSEVLTANVGEPAKDEVME